MKKFLLTPDPRGDWMSLDANCRRATIAESADGEPAVNAVAFANARSYIHAPLPVERKNAPLPVRSIGTRAFINRIPLETWTKVDEASKAETEFGVQLKKGLAELYAAESVESHNADLLGMLAALVSLQIITPAEREQILSF